MNNREWHASFDLTKASRITLINNAASGSERVGFKTRGKSCYGKNPDERGGMVTLLTLPYMGSILATTMGFQVV